MLMKNSDDTIGDRTRELPQRATIYIYIFFSLSLSLQCHHMPLMDFVVSLPVEAEV
jgi:hypothetical protein